MSTAKNNVYNEIIAGPFTEPTLCQVLYVHYPIKFSFLSRRTHRLRKVRPPAQGDPAVLWRGWGSVALVQSVCFKY